MERLAECEPGTVASMLYGHTFFPASVSASSSPATIECSVLYLSDVIDDDATSRILTMDAFYAIASDANGVMAAFGVSLRLSNLEWAIMTSLDKASRSLCWQGIAVAVLRCAGRPPLQPAAAARRDHGPQYLHCRLLRDGLRGLLQPVVPPPHPMRRGHGSGLYPGFCVDYTVEVMHFSNLGPASDPMGTKFMKGMRACGYDVLHGCITGMIGVGCLMLA